MIIEEKKFNLKNALEVTLRSPQSSEADLLLTHLQRLFRQSYKNLNRTPEHWDQFPIEEEVKILESVSIATNKFFISVFYENKIIGNLSLQGLGAEFNKQNGHIGMGLEKEFHQLGLGSKLLGYAIDHAKKNNFHRLELSVRTFNEGGIKLYEKMGFQRIGTAKEVAFIDGNFYDEHLYELLLK